jgi:hypothetical protein
MTWLTVMEYLCHKWARYVPLVVSTSRSFLRSWLILQSFCDTSYSRGGVNQMWILKNSKDLLEYIQSRFLSSCNSIKTFDFSTFYRRRVWRYQRGNQKPYIDEEQTTQWPKERAQKDKQWSTKHTYKIKDRVTRTPLKTGGKLRYSGRHMVYISLSWYDIPELVVPIRISLIEGYC